MVNRMVLNNLGYRPLRTALSVIAVAVEVLLIISVVGLVNGLIEESAGRQRGLGADIIVQPPGASNILFMSAAPMPVSVGGLAQKVQGVSAVTPVFWQSFGGLTLAYGIDVPSWNSVTGGFQVRQGRVILPGSYEVNVDDIYARDNNLRVGSSINLWNRDFRVAGIVEHGKGARLFVPLKEMQDLLGSQGKCSVLYIKLMDAGQMDSALAGLKKTLPGFNVRSMSEVTSLMLSGNLPGVKPFKIVMIGIAVIIGFLVIFLGMYTTVLERTREVGILKSLGASKGYIVGLILRETIIVSLIGIAAGIGGAYALQHFVTRAYPTLSIEITITWLVRAGIIAIAGAILGTAYPAWRAARQDPIAALAYE